jgi:hypothetical protein
VRLVVQVQAVVHKLVEVDFGRAFEASATISAIAAGTSAAVTAIAAGTSAPVATASAFATAARAPALVRSILLRPVLAGWSSLLFWHLQTLEIHFAGYKHRL